MPRRRAREKLRRAFRIDGNTDQLRVFSGEEERHEPSHTVPDQPAVGAVGKGAVAGIDMMDQLQEIILKLDLVIDIGMIADVVGPVVLRNGAPVPGDEYNGRVIHQRRNATEGQLVITFVAVEVINNRELLVGLCVVAGREIDAIGLRAAENGGIMAGVGLCVGACAENSQYNRPYPSENAMKVLKGINHFQKLIFILKFL